MKDYKMKKQLEEQKQAAMHVLKQLKAKKDEFENLVVYEFSSRCGVRLSQLLQEPTNPFPPPKGTNAGFEDKNPYSQLRCESETQTDSDDSN